jgi:ubiquinone/menaquinone biosynthesis C-methylase UbiE
VTSAGLADAYTAAAAGWAAGPDRIYRRLAAELIVRSPASLAGCTVLDIGAGVGAATHAITAAGGRPIATDAALAMLALHRDGRPPASQADAAALPLRPGSVGAVVASFVFNHLDDPAAGLREAARVTRQGGAILASSYAVDDVHPAKAAVERAMVETGWSPEPWYEHVRSVTTPSMATVAACEDVVARAGVDGTVEHVRVAFPDLGPGDLVAWRLGMAQYATHLAGLDHRGRGWLRMRSIELLGDDWPALERSVLFISALA